VRDMENQEVGSCALSQSSRTAFTAHTPGPWRARGPHGSQIAGPMGDGGSWLIAHTISHHPVDVANARLIAAAPDMLEALKEMLDVAELSECAPIEQGAECEAEVLCGHPDCNAVGCIIDKINRARAAIAKATGAA
jgi:hypothetical protein